MQALEDNHSDVETGEERLSDSLASSTPAPPPSSSGSAPPLSNDPPRKRSLADMEKVRAEIRQLQEKRAAAMMNEVVDLQNERNTALGRVKQLKETVEELTMENSVLKAAVGRGDQIQRLFHLEKSLMEEQLYSSDLKKKLQAANRQVSTLKARVMASETQKGKGNGSLSQLMAEEGSESILERSRSMNDLEQEFDPSKDASGTTEKGGSPPSLYHLSRMVLPKQQRNSPQAVTKEADTALKPPPSPLMGYSPSPTVVPRRYRLATAQCRTVGTQVDLMESIVVATDTTCPVSESTATQDEIEMLRDEKEALENKVSELGARIEEDTAEHRTVKNKIKQLKADGEVLSSNLSQFSMWVRQKIQLVEEDIDICRVIYSLHGSLSQEAALLRDLQDKLGISDEKIAMLTAENRRMAETVRYTEDEYRKMKQLNELQKEKIVLLTPSKSSQQTFYCPPSPLITSSPLTHRAAITHQSSPQHRRTPLHSTSSPLLLHHSHCSANTGSSGAPHGRGSPRAPRYKEVTSSPYSWGSPQNSQDSKTFYTHSSDDDSSVV